MIILQAYNFYDVSKELVALQASNTVQSAIKLLFLQFRMASAHKGSSKRRTKEEYLRIFMEFDADNSGSVSKSEIVKMFKACQMEIDEEQAEDLMNEIDADGGGELEQDEFIEFLKREDERIEFSLEECKRMFDYFADEQSETIGFEQLKHMFASLGEKITDYEVSKMIIFGDKNRDGKLDFQEFCKILKEI